jgi:hypothetical protein
MNLIILHDSATAHTADTGKDLLHSLLAIGDTGTSTILTRYVSVRVSCLRQNERTTAWDTLQHKREDYSCCKVVTCGHQQKGTHSLCKMPSTNLAEGGTHWGGGGDYIEGM